MTETATDSAADSAADTTTTPTASVVVPPLPPARLVEIADLGAVSVRHLDPGAATGPVVALLHGWTATADLNFFRCFEPVGERYRTIAFDHRGHGTGLRTRGSFRLEDCADDVIAVADALGIETIIPVGYSMGGSIAQLIWHRHPDRVAGLVLCATAPIFAERREERLSVIGISGLAALARLTPAQARRWITEQVYLQRKTDQWEPWAVAQASTHDWRMVLEAGRALGNFSSLEWLGGVDVPTSIIVTVRDEVIPVRRQIQLVTSIRHAQIHRIDAGHDAAVAAADQFVPALLRSIDAIAGHRRSMAATR